MAGEPCLGGADDALLLPRRDGFRGIVETSTRFHFDEEQPIALTRNDVDFSDWRLPAACGDAMPFASRYAAAFASADNPSRKAA